VNDHRRGTSRATEETVEDLDFAGAKFAGVMLDYGRAAHPNNIHLREDLKCLTSLGL
jgi:hypothetical protein